MGKIIYLIGLLLIIAWGIGLFGYTAGSMILVLITIAVIAIILKFINAIRSS